jgi:hypothetical protein
MKWLKDIITSVFPNQKEGQSQNPKKNEKPTLETIYNELLKITHKNFQAELLDNPKNVLRQLFDRLEIKMSVANDKNENEGQLVKSFVTDICQVAASDPSHVIGFTTYPTVCPQKLIYAVLVFGEKFQYIALEFTDDAPPVQKQPQNENDEIDEDDSTFHIELLDIYWLAGTDSSRALLVVFCVFFSSEVQKIFLAVVGYPADWLEKVVRLW